MKLILTESKLEQIIFKYLDNQNFVQVETDRTIFFGFKEDDEQAKIRYDKIDNVCIVHNDLIDEISSFFSLDKKNCKNLIGKWVENTIQMNVDFTLSQSSLIFN